MGTLARRVRKGEGGTSESESSSADIINYRPVAAQYQEALVVRVVMGLIGQDWCPFGKQDWQYVFETLQDTVFWLVFVPYLVSSGLVFLET